MFPVYFVGVRRQRSTHHNAMDFLRRVRFSCAPRDTTRIRKHGYKPGTVLWYVRVRTQGAVALSPTFDSAGQQQEQHQQQQQQQQQHSHTHAPVCTLLFSPHHPARKRSISVFSGKGVLLSRTVHARYVCDCYHYYSEC